MIEKESVNPSGPGVVSESTHTAAGPFVLGANLPWIAYGQDFGASAWRPSGGVAQADRGDRMRQALATLARTGIDTVRWWLLGDGRSGLRVDAQGVPTGVDDFFFADMDAAIEALRAAKLRAQFVLTDFLWFKAEKVVNGVQTGGRKALIDRQDLRAALVETVFSKVAERYAAETAVAGWDLMNEPDWTVLGLGTIDPFHSVSSGTMRAFFAELVSVFRRHGASQPLTVGVGRASSLGLTRDLGLDLYQMHWYESVDSIQTLAEPVASRGLERPLLLGEFPTVGASVTPERILQIAEKAGYSGALAWSLLAEDSATNTGACESALTWASTQWGGSASTQRA